MLDLVPDRIQFGHRQILNLQPSGVHFPLQTRKSGDELFGRIVESFFRFRAEFAGKTHSRKQKVADLFIDLGSVSVFDRFSDLVAFFIEFVENRVRIGKIESDGTVRDKSSFVVGKVASDGTVRDASNRIIGHAKGVPVRYAALFFFFDLTM